MGSNIIVSPSSDHKIAANVPHLHCPCHKKLSRLRPHYWAYFDRIRNSMKIQYALVSNIFDRSQRYFVHFTTVTLSWRVQNIVVIGRVYFTLECFEFSSNFEFDRNMLSGTGAWTQCDKLLLWGLRSKKNSLIFVLFRLLGNISSAVPRMYCPE